MGDVGDEILAHLFQLMDAGHVAHQQQSIAFAEAGDQDVQVLVVVERRGQLQRLAIVAAEKVVGKARMTHQVGDGLAEILGLAQAQQGLCGAIPPFQVAVTIHQDDGVAQGLGGGLGATDHGEQFLALALFVALAPIEPVEHLAPQALGFRRRARGLAQQPGVQAQEVP